jgi:hypothetical protein
VSAIRNLQCFADTNIIQRQLESELICRDVRSCKYITSTGIEVRTARSYVDALLLSSAILLYRGTIFIF